MRAAIMLDTLFEDSAIIVVNKPSGLLTQAPAGIDSLEARVKSHVIDNGGKIGKNGSCYLGVPHRLDRPSSGILLFGKNSRATRHISEQLENREVDKVYWALLEGKVEPAEATWIDYLRKIPDRPIAELAPPIDPLAREAILHYRVRRCLNTAHGVVTWLEIQLETGRMHQIRIQSASRGFPLLGDVLYGSRRPFGEPVEDERLRAIALHARSIALRHPVSKEPFALDAPPPGAWSSFIDFQ